MAAESARARLRGLYAITPPMRDSARLEALCAACLEGGARLLQYRAKDLAPGLALAQARALAGLCRAHGALFIVNDSVALALAAQADGVHLGRDDEPPGHARIVLREALIGVSCYDDPERARAAAAAGADYVAVGSVFASTTKPGAVRAPLEAVARARAAGGLPVAAIGGITLANAAEAIAAGADMVAVISALFDAPDVRAAAARFAALFETPAHGARDVPTQPGAV